VSSILCLCIAGGALPSWAAANDVTPHLHILGGSSTFRATIDVAGRAALQLLASQECQRVFSDFTDADGHTLKENLDARGQTARDYVLQTVRFVDGRGYTPRCQNRGISAVTVPGGVVVMVCEEQLRKLLTDTRYAGAVVIHEILHTLGLSENPPSSKEITDRVLARCR
jgi:hypothetical protein